MALDPMMTDALLGTFKNMVKECEDKGYSGEDFDLMKGYYDRMVELTQTHSDMNAYNGQVMQEALYTKFSDHYGRVLSSAATSAQEDKGYDDAGLLKQSIDALKDAVQRIKDGKQAALDTNKAFDPNKAAEDGLDFAQRNQDSTGLKISKRDLKRMKKAAKKEIKETLDARPNANDNSAEIEVLTQFDALIEAIEKLIALGEEPGMTLPNFLRIQIEKGLDRAAEGMFLVRDAYEYELEWAKANPLSPHHIKMAEEKIGLYDKLASESDFNIPHNNELTFGDEIIEYGFYDDIKKWGEITDAWEELIEDLSHWSLSYCKVAPYIDPWKMAENPKEACIQTQNIQPGIFKERARLFEKYFGISFLEIFKHPTFKWKVDHFSMDNSQEYTEFLIESIYPKCVPFQHLASETINQRQTYLDEKREGNPEYDKPLKRFMVFYDNKFGEGRYASKFPMPEKLERNAKPWNWDSFSLGN